MARRRCACAGAGKAARKRESGCPINQSPSNRGARGRSPGLSPNQPNFTVRSKRNGPQGIVRFTTQYFGLAVS